MRLFIKHMDGDSEYHNAKNCENAYWEHPTEHGKTHQPQRKMDRRTERVICRLMKQGIYFANAWTQEVKTNIEDNSENDKEIKGLMRCTIAHIYQDILRTYACEGWWGTYYAWWVVDQISGALKDTLGENHCKRGMYKEIELGHWPMRNQMKKWLKQNAQMQEKLAQEQIGDDCKGAQVKLEVGKTQEEKDKNKDKQTKDEVKQQVTKILQEVEEEMKNEEKQLRGSTAKAPKYPSVGEEDEKKDAEIEEHIKHAVEHAGDALQKVIVIPASGARATGTTQQTPETEKTSTDNTANTPSAPSVPPGPKGRSEDSKAGQPQAPASPPAPGEEGTQPVTGAARPKGPHEQSGEAQCQASLRPAAASSGGIVISTACTSDADLGGGKKVNAAIAHGDAPVDGGNDDPPPLNPPKPKPNPNPNQSGSEGGPTSGAPSTGGTGGGVSEAAGPSGPGAGGRGRSSSSGPGSTGHQHPGSSGPASPSTPHTPQIPSTAQNDQPAQNTPEEIVLGGGLTWHDLIPTLRTSEKNDDEHIEPFVTFRHCHSTKKYCSIYNAETCRHPITGTRWLGIRNLHLLPNDADNAHHACIRAPSSSYI
ncbi:hypothetical protein AK88_05299 [Plasmodium fragile]|uniref:Schizont-infected cell agglutination extracellular alpha domain-containing protein n=1 Tax=Plasmodium fragile TaxID=5857 RepID=A0A0D9QE51_PLAFR|nr:uncharacterized protein AK88_05299 [Plasmodium fragile]KJP85077.1 hypothetical protein AK88_05299 [Plasmodium fragile]